MTQQAAPAGKPAPIKMVEEAGRAIERLHAIMERLEAMVAEETALLRAGKLRDAVKADEAKAELARDFAMESARVKAAAAIAGRSLPEALGLLQKRHADFRSLLQTNLTVLATAHAVSEGIIRGVSGELARKEAPSTYGANGRANAPGNRALQPLAVSRSL